MQVSSLHFEIQLKKILNFITDLTNYIRIGVLYYSSTICYQYEGADLLKARLLR